MNPELAGAFDRLRDSIFSDVPGPRQEAAVTAFNTIYEAVEELQLKSGSEA